MSKIQQSVSRAFSLSTDPRINYHVTYKGAASLMTGIYETGELESAKFYSKPKIGDDESTKLGIIYGEVMISPYIIDSGVSSSNNDPNQILRTYRFIAGDEATEGIVTPTGPGGTPLQNIYYKDPNGQPQPIVNSDGRPSLGNTILATALGTAITSIPKIWDAIKGTSPNKTARVDPVTGKPIPTAGQQTVKEIAAQIPIGELSDVDDAGRSAGDVLTWDPNKNNWVAKSINELVGSSVFSGETEICGGEGGSGGSGGQGGSSTQEPYTTSNSQNAVQVSPDCFNALQPIEYGYYKADGTSVSLGTIDRKSVV